MKKKREKKEKRKKETIKRKNYNLKCFEQSDESKKKV